MCGNHGYGLFKLIILNSIEQLINNKILSENGTSKNETVKMAQAIMAGSNGR